MIQFAIVLYKLHHYGIREVGNQLIESYLTNRMDYVEINNVASNRLPLKYGVPQGSVLGPLLFLIYINDLHNAVHTSPRLFADDICLLLQAPNNDTLEDLANSELKRVNQWMLTNKLSLNHHKTQLMVLSKNRNQISVPFGVFANDVQLQTFNNVKYLGMIIVDKLTFTSHIDKIEHKITCAFGVICKLKPFVPQQTLIDLYYAVMYPH